MSRSEELRGLITRVTRLWRAPQLPVSAGALWPRVPQWLGNNAPGVLWPRSMSGPGTIRDLLINSKTLMASDDQTMPGSQMRINQSLCTGGRALAPGKNRVLYGIGERGVSVANCDGEFNHKQMIENWWWDSDKNLFNKELLMKIIQAKWRQKTLSIIVRFYFGQLHYPPCFSLSYACPHLLPMFDRCCAD